MERRCKFTSLVLVVSEPAQVRLKVAALFESYLRGKDGAITEVKRGEVCIGVVEPEPE